MGYIGGKMSVLVVGSIAFDSVETPHGKIDNALGGSATYFSVAASFFTDVKMVGVVGKDFPKEHLDFLKGRNVDTEGVKCIDGETFRWGGKYIEEDLNNAETLFTELNVFEDFNPDLPEEYRNTPYLFLANINPELQLRVLEQSQNPKIVACDTMNLWINISRNELIDVLKKIDILILNDAEAKEFTQKSNLISAAKTIIREYGLNRVIIKKGEHGAISMTEEKFFSAPAYPLEIVVDPTGAGDSFAGGFMGYLASTDELSENGIRKAIIYGTVMASFNVEDFSFNRMRTLTKEEIDIRFSELQKSSQF